MKCPYCGSKGACIIGVAHPPTTTLDAMFGAAKKPASRPKAVGTPDGQVKKLNSMERVENPK